MREDILSDVFRDYMGNKNRTTEIASHFDAVIQAALHTPLGESIENLDGFSDKPADRQISTIRTKQPDEYSESSDAVIEIFSEGRARITASRHKQPSEELLHREERTIYFDSQEHPSQVASRMLSALVDIQENHVCEAMREYVATKAPHMATKPVAGM